MAYRPPTQGEIAAGTPLIAAPVEFSSTGAAIEEFRIQEILEQGPELTAANYMERFRAARDEVRATPLPKDFDAESVITAIARFGQEAAISTREALLAQGYRPEDIDTIRL